RMQRATPRKRKQVFPEGSPSGSPSKFQDHIIQVDSSPERRIIRRNIPRSWEEEQQMIKDAGEILEAEEAEGTDEKIEVDHVEEVEELEEEEEVDVDDQPEEDVSHEEVIEEGIYDDEFNIPADADDYHTIHVSGGGKTGGSRRYLQREYPGSGYSTIPRIHDGEAQFGGQMRRGNMKYVRIQPGNVPRPPVHLRTTDGVAQQPRARLLPVAIARPAIHNRYGQSYGQNYSMVHWREDQKRKMELLDIFESLPAEKQGTFLNYLNQTGESFIPPPSRKGRRPGEGSSSHQTITRMRALPNEMHQHHTVQVPAHMAQDGAEILISPQPDGRTTLMSLIPVGEEEGERMDRDKGSGTMKMRKEEDEGREEDEEGEADTSDMPLLEADKEALEKRKEERRRRERERERERENGDNGGEWNGMEEDVDVENVEENERRLEEGEDEEAEEGNIPMLSSEVRGRRGLFYVPELDGYNYEQRYQMCAPKMKGGLRLCESCNIYMRKSVFYHHQRTIREHGSCSAMTPKRFECGVPECDERLPTIERLCVHMAELHNMPTDVQETEFSNEDEFQAFLVELESKGGNFRMSRGNKCGKSGVVRYYRCNRVSGPVARGRPRKLVNPTDSLHPDPHDPSELVEAGVEMEVEEKKKKHALVRTEKICTAFYRKAEMNDGRISVRYCDFHLHEDIKVKLPDSVKERIMEMLAKKLPMPVIVEVIKAESEQFARLGSELERRIYSIGEKDVRNVYCTYLAKKRKPGANPGLPEEMGPLNDNEERFLMAFEKAEGKSIHEVAKGSKVTLERRRRRDALRNRADNVQKFFKTERFVEFSDAQLSKLENIFGSLSEMCYVIDTSITTEKMDSTMDDIMEEDDIEEEEGERAVGEILGEIERMEGEMEKENGKRMEGGEDHREDEGEMDGGEGGGENTQPSTSTTAAGETPVVRKRGRPRKHPITPGEEKKKREEMEVEDEDYMDGIIKEEDLEEELIRSPIVTSRGRLTKPKKFDDY
ncbi:hypothetical protein PENTCL1PPCAC_26408, partial [Pristionchus entomophagus]